MIQQALARQESLNCAFEGSEMESPKGHCSLKSTGIRLPAPVAASRGTGFADLYGA